MEGMGFVYMPGSHGFIHRNGRISIDRTVVKELIKARMGLNPCHENSISNEEIKMVYKYDFIFYF